MLEVTVFDENGDKAPSFLGKVAIPLLTVCCFVFFYLIISLIYIQNMNYFQCYRFLR